jgi:hypothetical protein
VTLETGAKDRTPRPGPLPHNGGVRMVPECITDLPDRDSPSVIELYEGILGPKPLAHLFTGDGLSWGTHQNCGQAVMADLANSAGCRASEHGLTGLSIWNGPSLYSVFIVRFPQRHAPPLGHKG